MSDPTVPQQPYEPTAGNAASEQPQPVGAYAPVASTPQYAPQAYLSEQSAHTQPPSYVSGPPQAGRPRGATTLGETNTYAVLSIIFAFIVPVLAIIFGHMGLNQIKRNGDAGRGLALTGTIVGYAYFIIIALVVMLYLSMIAIAVASFGAFASGYDGFADLSSI